MQVCEYSACVTVSAIGISMVHRCDPVVIPTVRPTSGLLTQEHEKTVAGSTNLTSPEIVFPSFSTLALQKY